MWQRARRSLSFSNVVALAALFFALGGAAYAAAGKISGAQIKPNSIPANRIKRKSISAKQLSANAVSAAQIRAGSLTGAQIKAGSLTGTEVVGSTLTGVSAAAIGTLQYATVQVPMSGSSATTATASCPVGMKVIGGGANTSEPAFGDITESWPSSTRSGWTAVGIGEPGMAMTVTAICTPVVNAIG